MFISRQTVERFCEKMQRGSLQDFCPTMMKWEVQQTSGSKNTDNGRRELRKCKTKFVRIQSTSFVWTCKICWNDFSLDKWCGDRFRGRAARDSAASCRLSLSVSVTRPPAAAAAAAEGFLLGFKQIEINFLTHSRGVLVVYALRESAVNKIHFARWQIYWR